MATETIKYLWYEPDGQKSVIYNTWGSPDPEDMKTDGSFDAAVFNGRLYVIFVRDENVKVGWCTTEAGYDCAWHRYEDGNISRNLWIWGYSGLGVEVGANLNGTGQTETEYLYIVSSNFMICDGCIGIYQVDTNEEVRHYALIPDYYPSFYSMGEIGVRMVKSAFPNGNYLYLAWADRITGRIFKAILQRFDDTTVDYTLNYNDYWITWSNDIYINSSTGGVRFVKAPGVATGGIGTIELLFTSDDDLINSAGIFGLY